MAEEIKDGTQIVIDDKGKGGALSSEATPEIKAAIESQKKLDGLLKDQGFDSLEDLTQSIQDSTDFKKKFGDLNIDELKEKAGTLDKYNDYWAAEEAKKKEEETDEDKLVRLEKDIKDIRSINEKDQTARKETADAEKVINDFTNEINSLMKKNEDIPEEYHSFLGEFLGVKNPFNEIDITSNNEVRKMAKDGIKKMQDFEQVIIKRYRDGKIKIPDITPAEAAAPDDKKPNVKNLKEARTGMLESLTKHFMGAK